VWFIRKGRNATTAPDVAPLFLGVMILATGIFIVLGVKVGGHSLWQYIYHYFPGAGAIRAVSRYMIFLTLPMSIAFAYGLQQALQCAAGKRALTVAVLLVAAFGVFEQFGVPQVNGAGFSTTVEQAYLKTMAARLPADCAAFYVAPGPNPRHSTAEYQYDGMMISAVSRVKTLNASSSQFPRDWGFYFFKNPNYESKVKEWIDSQKITGKVCRLELYPEVESFDPSLPSPVDDPEFFVRQLYRDFTAAEPQNDVAAQLAKLTNCRRGDDACSREQIALNVFLSTGFHERGFFVLRMYEAALGRLPHFEEFMAEMARPRELTKEQMIAGLVGRHLPERVIDEKKVAQLVDSDELRHRLGNRSFVALHYYGFLRREPDAKGLEGWVALIDRSGDAAKVTKGFIDSFEYRQRFRN
jgi:hypothetical protein